MLQVRGGTIIKAVQMVKVRYHDHAGEENQQKLWTFVAIIGTR